MAQKAKEKSNYGRHSYKAATEAFYGRLLSENSQAIFKPLY